MQNKPLITVFTPTFNRAHTLHRVFSSLCGQSNSCFEWLIVDDGSNDNTFELIEYYKSQLPEFEINYFFQVNQGKHIAINTGLKYAKGDFFLIADSDDYFDPHTIEIFLKKWDNLPLSVKSNCAGIWCNCKNEDLELVGNLFPFEGLYTYFDFKYKHKIYGEKWHIERTEIMKEFPFPDIKIGNKFYYGEGAIWRKIYSKYNFYGINDKLRTYVNSEDGIMHNMKDNPYKMDTLILGYLEMINEDSKYFFYSVAEFLLAFFLLVHYSKTRNYTFFQTIEKVNSIFFKLMICIIWPFNFLISWIFKLEKFSFFKVNNA